MQSFTLDLSRLTVVPDRSKGSIVSAAPRSPRSSAERSIIKTALEFGKPFNSTLGAAIEVVGISEKALTVRVVPSPTVPMTSKRLGDLTVGFGLTGTGAIGPGLNVSGGIYGSTTPEFGLFATGGFVIGTPGASGGVELTFVFGTPSDFAGPFFSIQASVGTGAALGGSLLFSLPTTSSPSFAFMGFTINTTAGISAIPVSVSIEFSNTAIKPVLRPKK